MKKLYIIIASAIAALTLIVIISINLYEEYSFNGVEEVHTMKSNYTYNIAGDNTIEILCFSNNPKSFLSSYKDVIGTFKDSSEKIILSANIIKSSRVSTHKYNDQRFYGYKLYIDPVDVNFTFDIKNCIFETRDFTSTIGNLTVVNYKDKSNTLDFSKIYAIGNSYMGFKSLTGFVITFTNSSSTPLTVYDFYIGEYNYCNLSQAVVLSSDISYGTDIKEYVPNYSPYSYSQGGSNVVVPAKSSVKVLIPVYYSNKSFLGNTLIYINEQLYIDNSNYLTNYDDLDTYKDILLESKLHNT